MVSNISVPGDAMWQSMAANLLVKADGRVGLHLLLCRACTSWSDSPNVACWHTVLGRGSPAYVAEAVVFCCHLADPALKQTVLEQAEERAQLCLASQKQSHMLRLRKSDLVLYAARVIPGNDKQVCLHHRDCPAA